MIEALENRGIRPDLVVGTSAGALFGALYCHFGNVGDVFREVELVFGSGEFREFEGKYFGERKPADGHVQFGIRHFISGLAGTLKNGMHLGKALATSAMVAEKDAVSRHHLPDPEDFLRGRGRGPGRGSPRGRMD